MSATLSVKRGQRKPLLEGANMRCPRCKELRNILAFVPMGMIEEYMDDTAPVYKCPGCKWIFSPAESLIIENLGRSINKNES